MTEDDWITAAMADHTLVAQLLLKLNQPPPRRFNDVYAPALRLDWSVKQRRSKQAALRNKADVARASPTTPLSWSGGTSDSCCAADESKPIDTARSKVIVVSDTTITKRSRKKKTLPELKEEESLLLKERRDLKNQLATMRLAVEKQREENDWLKRLKVDMSSRRTPEINSTTVESEKIESIKQKKVVACDPTTPIMETNLIRSKLVPPPIDSLGKKQAGGGCSFMLPDLNLPGDENSDSNVLCGVC